MASYEDVFPILPRIEGIEWKKNDPAVADAICPGHDDGQKKGKKSLCIKVKEDECGQLKLLLYCHACQGDTTKNILNALGLTVSSLFPDRSKQRSGSGQSSGKGGAADGSKIVKGYSYHNAEGKIHHQTTRYEPKRFSQRRPAKAGEVYVTASREYRAYPDRQGNYWINTLQGIEPVLYRLPQLLAADLKKLIIWVEGEKDADNVAAKFPGAIVTTCPMGSGKFRPSYLEYFRGRRIAIVPDVDKPNVGHTDPKQNPGWLGAQKIASELTKVAADVRILELPDRGLKPKWDATDWLESGGTAAEFAAAYQAAPNLVTIQPSDSPQRKTGSGTYSQPDKLPLTNYREIFTDGTPTIEPLASPIMCHRANESCGNTIKSENGRLYAFDNGRVRYLDKPDHLCAYIGEKTGTPPDFKSASGLHTKGEFFASMKHSVPSFEGIESFPHWPQITDHDYCHPEMPVATGKHICELFDRFTYQTPLDRDLATSVLLTLLWGGPPGQRPLFVISATGQGSGKTTFVEVMASIVGGEIAFSSASLDLEKITKTLLNGGSLSKRVCFLDNVKFARFSNADLESLITRADVSGWRLFSGEASRKNYLTWMMSINAPELGRDLATRTIWIQLGQPSYSTTWLSDIQRFIGEHRLSIISDGM